MQFNAMTEEEILALSYRELQKACKEAGLPSGGSTEVLRERLRNPPPSNADKDDSDEEEAEEWRKSKAKAILREGILSGEIKPEWKPMKVFQMNDEHKKWQNKYSSWSSGLRRLRQAYGRDKSRSESDLASYKRDLVIVKSKRTGPEPWHRSAAAECLKQDVKEGNHKGKTPSELYNGPNKEAYNAFDLSEFRKHLYQEQDKEPKRAVRFEKKKKSWKFPELHKDHPRQTQG